MITFTKSEKLSDVNYKATKPQLRNRVPLMLTRYFPG